MNNKLTYFMVGFLLACAVVVIQGAKAEPTTCPSGSYEIGRDDSGNAICKMEPTGCPYGDSIPLGPECDMHAGDQANQPPIGESTAPPAPVASTEQSNNTCQGK